ncbi:MAG TPA: hypothetical protein VHY08_01545 [Bacillota bacterium]|nr:hypothetical protein [Bacillota bacterium]
MELGNGIQKGFDLFFKNFGVLFLACLIMGIISAITIGILAGPLVGAVLVLCLKLLQGEKGELKELLAHFDQFMPTLKATFMYATAGALIWVICRIPFIGWIITLIVSPALGMLYFLTIGFIVDQKMKPMEALRRSVDCFAFQPLMSWLYSLIVMLLAGMGALLFLIPVFLTMPLGVMGMAIAYRQLSTCEVPPFKPGRPSLRIAGIILAALFLAGLACMILGYERSFFGVPAWIRW